MFSESSIDNLKALVNVVDVVGKSVNLKKQGSDFLGLCPFHTEKTASFHVSPSKQIYKCFGCGKSGDAIAFVMEHDNRTYPEALEYLAKEFNIELESDTPKEYVKPEPRLQKVSDKLVKYFEGRGISNNTLLRFKITEGREWMPQVQSEVPVICFNYYREGELINIKFRSAKKDFKLAKNAELIFYNLDSIRDQEVIFIVEGEMDALSLYEAGIYAVISVPNGAGSKNLDFLGNCADYFKDVKEVVLMTDNDAPGRTLRDELARRIGYERCSQVHYPSGCKDSNEVLVKFGPKELERVCNERTEWPLEGILTVFDQVDQVIDFYDHGYPNGYEVRLPGFKDTIDLQFMLGQFMSVTGIPGSGKSEFIDWIMVRMAIDHDWKWAICSPENIPSSLHITKLLEKYCGKAFGFRKDISNRISRDELSNALYFLHEHFFFVNVEENTMTLEGIHEKVRDLVFRKGIKGFLLDPWNKVEHNIGNGLNETQATNKALTKVSSFSKMNQVFSILIAHPTKMKKDPNGKFEVPNLYSISGSSNWYNQTDVGATVYRDRDTGVVSFYLQKVRFHWLGKEGKVDYSFNTETRQYSVSNGLHPPDNNAQLFIQENPF